MAYGLQDVVNQRRMIDESPAADEFKQVLRGKLDALLGLAEASDCRRVRLLAYFGEKSAVASPAAIATTACTRPRCTTPPSRRASCSRASTACSRPAAPRSAPGHIMDILRGKRTDKVAQYGHDKLSTFGIGADLSETQWRALLRQLIAARRCRWTTRTTTRCTWPTRRAPS
jgi:ATP-dependent DNA helicase RecQ